jgi:hypothetical protein
VIGRHNRSDPLGKRKYLDFLFWLFQMHRKDLTQEKWYEVLGKSETLAGGRLN